MLATKPDTEEDACVDFLGSDPRLAVLGAGAGKWFSLAAGAEGVTGPADGGGSSAR